MSTSAPLRRCVMKGTRLGASGQGTVRRSTSSHPPTLCGCLLSGWKKELDLGD